MLGVRDFPRVHFLLGSKFKFLDSTIYIPASFTVICGCRGIAPVESIAIRKPGINLFMGSSFALTLRVSVGLPGCANGTFSTARRPAPRMNRC